LLEDNSGILLLESADVLNPLTASANDASFLLDDGTVQDENTVLDIPRIYFPIHDNFINDSGKASTPLSVNSFIITLLQLSDNENLDPIVDFIISGNYYDDENPLTDDELLPGKDYFINETFADYLIDVCLGVVDEDLLEQNSELGLKVKAIRDIQLPNYLQSDSYINTPWVELSDDEQSNTDLSQYAILNKYEKYGVTDATLEEFYVSFVNGILNMNLDKQILTPKDALYKTVLDYFNAAQNDETINKINLILGSTYSGQQINTASSYCKCNGSSSNSMTDTCASLYSNAMLEHLKTMLGDPEFYCSWMYMDESLNTELIGYLKYLILKLKDKGFTLSDTTYSFKCSCPSNVTDDNKNYKVLDNYTKVLDFVAQCSIKSNINKIKLWGSQFGDLLPKLYFI
jgi:hypothetical protein